MENFKDKHCNTDCFYYYDQKSYFTSVFSEKSDFRKTKVQRFSFKRMRSYFMYKRVLHFEIVYYQVG